jgi:hypothetical protein
MFDTDALDGALRRRVVPLASNADSVPVGLIDALAESWNLASEWVDALQFLSRRYLEEFQAEEMEFRQANWPGPTHGPLPEPTVVVDTAGGEARLLFMKGGDVVLELPPISFREIGLSGSIL